MYNVPAVHMDIYSIYKYTVLWIYIYICMYVEQRRWIYIAHTAHVYIYVLWIHRKKYGKIYFIPIHLHIRSHANICAYSRHIMHIHIYRFVFFIILDKHILVNCKGYSKSFTLWKYKNIFFTYRESCSSLLGESYIFSPTLEKKQRTWTTTYICMIAYKQIYTVYRKHIFPYMCPYIHSTCM